MRAYLSDPSYITLEDLSASDEAQLKSLFTYTDEKAAHDVNRFRHAQWYIRKHGQEEWEEELARLESLVEVCLLEEQRGGKYRLISGFADMLRNQGIEVENDLQYVDHKSLAVVGQLKKPRYYQQEAFDELISRQHAAIELPTGSGKSLVIAKLIREIGLKAVVIAPTKSIAEQLYDDLTDIFGAKRVGMIGDGKKVTSKQITVGIKDSLSNLEPGTEHWQNISRCELMIVDESHTVPQQTLKHVCLGVCRDAQYRYFVSATQMRNDGKDLLLNGIIGPIVYRKTLEELVEEGFLARPIHYGIELDSHSRFLCEDVLELTRAHYYESPVIGHAFADLANKFVQHYNHQVLILVDEISQFKHLYPHLKYECKFAHGGVTPKNKDQLPEMFHKSKPKELVKMFNDRKLKVLIGTSCIATGTDIRPTDTLLYWMAGKSEIKYSQARGRGTRLVEGKTSFNFVDCQLNIPGLDNYSNPFYRHFKTRCEYANQKVKMIRP